MEALNLLKHDHRKVKELFRKVEATSLNAAKTREKLFKKIKEELKNHTELEEKLFYPKLKEYDQTKELIFEFEPQHAIVDFLLSNIEKEEIKTLEWEAKIRVLRTEVENHVYEEEQKLFPRVKKLVAPSELKAWGEEMLRFKNKSAINIVKRIMQTVQPQLEGERKNNNRETIGADEEESERHN